MRSLRLAVDLNRALASTEDSPPPRTISGTLLEAVINPSQGGDIVSLRHVPTGQEVLWRHPRWVDQLPSGGGSDPTPEGFYDNYPGGIQELFPNAGPACVVEEAPLAFHGEACRVPWKIESTVGRATVVLTAELKRYPFALRRTVTIDSTEPVLRIRSEIQNKSSRRLPFHWGLHPVFAPSVTAEPAYLEGAFDRVRSHPETFGNKQVHKPGAEFLTDGRLELTASDAKCADLLYARCEAGKATISSQAENGLAVTLTWPVDVFPELWIWQECHDQAGYPWFGIHHVVGIEPHTSAPAHGLAASRDRESCHWSGPYEHHAVEFEFRVEAAAGRDEVASRDGNSETKRKKPTT